MCAHRHERASASGWMNAQIGLLCAGVKRVDLAPAAAPIGSRLSPRLRCVAGLGGPLVRSVTWCLYLCKITCRRAVKGVRETRKAANSVETGMTHGR
jgi:hypothetical protein